MKYILAICMILILGSCKTKKKESAQINDTYFTCSMHPQIMEERPGKCPICGMTLISVKKNPDQLENVIMLSDQQVQLGNIQVDTIGKGKIGNTTVLNAALTIDETKSTAVSSRIAGRIDKLYFKNAGEHIKKGDRLYDLYSEALNNAKQEYILALEKERVLDHSIIDFKQLVEAAKNKLLLWGMSPDQIAILRLSDLSQLWAEAQVYTSQLSDIDTRGTVVVQMPDLGKEITGNIELVNPEINPDTRINLVRVAISNKGNELKPGMPAYVTIKNRQNNVLTLSADAIIR